MISKCTLVNLPLTRSEAPPSWSTPNSTALLFLKGNF